jgi:hypothetical protein
MYLMYSKQGFPSTILGGQNACFIFTLTWACNKCENTFGQVGNIRQNRGNTKSTRKNLDRKLLLAYEQ